MENIKQAISFDDFYKLVLLNNDNYCMTYELSDEIKNRTKIVYDKDDYLSNLENSFKDKDNFLYESINKILDYKNFEIIPIEDFFIKLNTTFELILEKIKEIFIKPSELALNEIYIHYQEINKSNFWLSLLLCKYLNDKNLNDNIKKNIFFIDDVELIKNRDKQIKKNIFFIDDCSYSGAQLNGIIQKYNNLYSIKNYLIFKFNEKLNEENLNDEILDEENLDDENLDDFNLNDENLDLDDDKTLKIVKNIKYNILKNIYNIQKINVFTIYISKFANDLLIKNFKDDDKFFLSSSSLSESILLDIYNDKPLFYLLIDNSYVFVEEINNEEIVLIDILQYLGITNTRVIPKLLEIKSADSLSSLQYLYNYIKPPMINIKNINNVKLYKLKETFKNKVISNFNDNKIGNKFFNTNYILIDHKNLNIQTKKQFGLLNGCYNSKYYEFLNKEIQFDYKNEELCYSAFYRKEKFIFNEDIINFLKKSCVTKENMDFIENYKNENYENMNKNMDYTINGRNLNNYKFKYQKYI